MKKNLFLSPISFFLFGAQEIKADSLDFYINSGNEFLDNNNFTQAIVAFTKAIEINPQNDFALYNRGLLKRNHFNDWEGAMEDFQKSKLDSSGGLNFIYKYPYQSLIFFAILFTTAFIIILLVY